MIPMAVHLTKIETRYYISPDGSTHVISKMRVAWNGVQNLGGKVGGWMGGR